MEFEYTWTPENIQEFIQLRCKFKICPDLPTETPQYIYQHILNELGLTHQVEVASCHKLWTSLVSKYKSFNSASVENDWPHYSAMHDALYSIHNEPEATQSVLATKSLAEENGAMSQKPDLVMEQPEETIEEEAARLEEAFRRGEIVALPSLEIEIDGQVQSGDDESEINSDDEEQQSGTSPSLSQGFALEDVNSSDIWSEELTLQFISLRGQKEFDSLHFGQKYIFKEILKEMGMLDQISVVNARKKWSLLAKKYRTLKSEEEQQTSGYDSENTFENGVQNDSKPPSKEKPSWLYYEAMEEVMKKIKKTSPDGGIKTRKSPEFLWSHEVTKKFIRLRAEKHSEISIKGHNAIYQEIVDQLMISDKVTVMMARKKWNSLLKRYQEEEAAEGDCNWPFMKDMKHVLKNFRCSDAAAKLKSRASPEFLWPNDLTKKFIEMRASKHSNFLESGIQETYMEIMEDLGLDHILNPNQLRKKWNYLVAKYKELSCTTAPDGSTPAPHSWPFYDDMQKAMLVIPENFNNASKIVKVNFENIWTKEVVIQFIRLRGSKGPHDTKRVSAMFIEIIKELNLTGQITAHQARKKWNYLYTKYLDLCQPGVDEFTRNSWVYYSEMQKAVGTLPLSQLISKKGIGGEEVDEERQKQYTCFVCGKSGKVLNEFFMFERNQKLLHTQKTALEIISHLVNRKLLNMESTTCMCSRCTNLVNEADSIINRHEKLKEETQQLLSNAMAEAKAEKARLVQLQRQQHRTEPSTPDSANEERNSSSPITANPYFVDEEEEIGVKPEEIVTYSKRGRKRRVTHTLSSLNLRPVIKSEPIDDEFDSFEDDLESEEEGRKRKKAKLKRRGRSRGRTRGKKRGRPPASKITTLIGRGLGGQYPNTNKRKLIPFKGPKIYHCTECTSEFKKYTDLVAHKKDIHSVIDTSTLEVEETILENGVITYFNKGKANNSETCHPCRECDKYFLRKDDLWYHQEIAHTKGKGRAKTAFKDRSYACEECGEIFLFKYKLKMHINSKHLNDAGQTANDFTCGDCGCKLGSLPGLTFHMRKHHNKSLTYRKATEYLCSNCGFLAGSNKKLKEHQEAHCGVSSKPKVQCEICGKTVLKVSLKMHKVKMHSDFKEQCDRCGERYATKTDLLRHINVVHLGILLYNCQYCGEKFPTSDALRYHRVKNHEKPSFICEICMKCYKRIGELNTHIKRSHNDRRKAEVCQYCGKEYYDRSGLRNHLVGKHNIPQELTYSENYLRKKRVDGLPLAKHMEKRGMVKATFIPMEPSPMDQPPNPNPQQQQQQPQQHLHPVVHPHHQPQQQQVPPQQPHPQAQRPHPHPNDPNAVVMAPQHHTHLRVGVVDEAAEAARNLGGAYQELPTHNNEEESSLVVTEITENSSQVQQTVLVDALTPHGMVQHHPQIAAHMQPPIAMHPHMHHPMQHHPTNARFGVLYQMNMHHPGPSHINM